MSLLFCTILLHIPKWTIIIHPNVTNYIFYRSLFNSFFPPFLSSLHSEVFKLIHPFISSLLNIFSLIEDVGDMSFEFLHILKYISIALTGG